MTQPLNSNRCGFCNNFKLDENDICLIPVGMCSDKNDPNVLIDFHNNECNHFSIKPGLNRTINCNGCNFELWPEFSCECSRNYTSEIDCYHKS